MLDLGVEPQSQNAVTRKKGSLNLAKVVNDSATKLPALTGYIPRRQQARRIYYPTGLYRQEETEDETDVPQSFCLMGTAMTPQPRQFSRMFLTGKVKSYISSSNAEDSEGNVNVCSRKNIVKKRRRRRRKRSKSSKNDPIDDADAVGGSGGVTTKPPVTQKVVKMLKDGSLLLCRVPVVDENPYSHRQVDKSRSRSRSKSRNRSRSRKPPVSQATRVHHQMAKSAVCFQMVTPSENQPICFTVKRENRHHGRAVPSYHYHDVQMCNRCLMLKKKRELRAALRAPKHKHFGVQTDLKPEADVEVEKPHAQLIPTAPTKSILVMSPKRSSDARETTPPTPPVQKSENRLAAVPRNKPTLSKSLNSGSPSSVFPRRALMTNPIAKTTLPSTGNQIASHLCLNCPLPITSAKYSLSKEIVDKARRHTSPTMMGETSDSGRGRNGLVRLRSLGHNQSFYLVGPSSVTNASHRMLPFGDICKAAA